MNDESKTKKQLIEELREHRGRLAESEALNTELKSAEEKIKESEEYFRSIAENTQDYIMRYDEKCRHLYENPAALRVSDMTAEDIIGIQCGSATLAEATSSGVL